MLSQSDGVNRRRGDLDAEGRDIGRKCLIAFRRAGDVCCDAGALIVTKYRWALLWFVRRDGLRSRIYWLARRRRLTSIIITEKWDRYARALGDESGMRARVRSKAKRAAPLMAPVSPEPVNTTPRRACNTAACDLGDTLVAWILLADTCRAKPICSGSQSLANFCDPGEHTHSLNMPPFGLSRSSGKSSRSTSGRHGERFTSGSFLLSWRMCPRR